MHLPRRMLGRDVERLEIVPVVLDVRPFGDGEAHVGEDRDDLVGDLAHRMDAPLGALRAGSVTSIRSASSRASSGHLVAARPCGGQGLLELALERVEGLSRLGRCSAGRLPSRLTSSVTLPFLPRRRPAPPRARQVGSRGDPAQMSPRRSSSSRPSVPPASRTRRQQKGASRPLVASPGLGARWAPPGHAWRAASACLTKTANAAPSWTAISASTLRSSPTPASLRPCMNRP